MEKMRQELESTLRKLKSRDQDILRLKADLTKLIGDTEEMERLLA